MSGWVKKIVPSVRYTLDMMIPTLDFKCIEQPKNPDLQRGLLFRYRAQDLLACLKKQPAPYTGTDSDLAELICIGERTVARYLRYLRSNRLIDSEYTPIKIAGSWINARKITVMPEGQK